MPKPSLPERVAILEEKVDSLAALPARVAGLESQVLQLRDEMRAGFSAIRSEFETTIRSALAAFRDEFRVEMRAEMHAEVHARGETLRGEIRAGDEETRRYMLVLHEDLVARISVIGEGQPPRRKRR